MAGISNKRIILTGGAGFIGSHLVEELSRSNKIVIFDNCSRDAIKFTSILENKNVEFIKGDILDAEQVNKATKNVDIIIHLAAIAGVATVLNNPTKTFKVNLIGTYNLLEAAKGLKLDRFVDFSTSEVYGKMANNVTEESETKQGPISESRWVYAVSKLSSEFLTHSYHAEFGLPSVSIRPFNIYGPRQIGEGAIHNFIEKSLSGEDLIVNGSGEQVRAWCHVKDMVNAVVKALTCDEAIGQSFNIGNPKAALTTNELARKITKLIGSKSKIVNRKINYPEIENRVPNVDKAGKILGYRPSIDIEEGLIDTINGIRAKNEDINHRRFWIHRQEFSPEI
jgi:UDP-glucuronate decarboxylase